jgi:farnesyl diphosphate synthase
MYVLALSAVLLSSEQARSILEDAFAHGSVVFAENHWPVLAATLAVSLVCSIISTLLMKSLSNEDVHSTISKSVSKVNCVISGVSAVTAAVGGGMMLTLASKFRLADGSLENRALSVDDWFGEGCSRSLLAMIATFLISLLSVRQMMEALNRSQGRSSGTSSGSSSGKWISLVSMSKAEQKQDFLGAFPNLVDDIASALEPIYEMTDDARDWIRESMEYNVPHGKLNRGMAVVHAVHALTSVEKTVNGSATLAIPEDIHEKANVLGWMVEWLQAFLLVADDIMDESTTRRGQPCWYLIPKVGINAVNDSFLLQSNIFSLLKKYFGDSPSIHLKLVDAFNEVSLQTELGQLLDLTSQPLDRPSDLSRFTLQRYKLIVKYKTAFYTFYLPVALALILAKKDDEETLKITRDICCQLGEYFQVQDDYLDCYGDPKVIGKIGTDIEDNKCGWLVVQALDRATPKQRKIINANYGKGHDQKHHKCVGAIKKLYVEMDLEKVYQDYEDGIYKKLQKAIAAVEKEPLREIFSGLLKKIHKRAK